MKNKQESVRIIRDKMHPYMLFHGNLLLEKSCMLLSPLILVSVLFHPTIRAYSCNFFSCMLYLYY